MSIDFGPRLDEVTGKRVMTEAQYEAAVAAYSPDGIIGSTGDTPPLSIVGGQLVLRAGLSGILRGYQWSTPTDTIVPIADNPPGAVRLDHVVLRLDRDVSPRTLDVAVKQPAPGAALPSLTQQAGPAGRFEFSLGQVSVPSGATVATATVTSRAIYIGPDGQIRCFATARPPHSSGRTIWEDGRLLVSDGATWQVIYEDAGALALTYQPGWATSTGFGYATRVNGFATAQVSVQRTGAALGNGQHQVATLPSTIRPRSPIEVPVTVIYPNSATAPAHGRLYPDGKVNALLFSGGMPANGYLVFAPATYPAA